MEKSSWLDTEEVLRRVNKDTQILNCIWQNTYLALVFGKGNIDGLAMYCNIMDSGLSIFLKLLKF